MQLTVYLPRVYYVKLASWNLTWSIVTVLNSLQLDLYWYFLREAFFGNAAKEIWHLRVSVDFLEILFALSFWIFIANCRDFL